MIAYHDFVAAFRRLEIPPDAPVIAHASLSAFGEVQGGADALLGAMMRVYETIVMPGFTFKTMLIPESGPRDNGLTYGQSADANLMAQFFHPGMPVDRLMGAVPEALRKHPQAARSMHPILSFVGIHARSILESQTVDDPLKPVERLLESQGWVLLLGVDHDVNTSIHYAEHLAGRKQFIRWALTPNGVVACPQFPGCSDGFFQIAPRIAQYAREELLANGRLLAIPLNHLIEVARSWIQADPLALLCDRSYCERCESVRVHVRAHPDRKTAP